MSYSLIKIQIEGPMVAECFQFGGGEGGGEDLCWVLGVETIVAVGLYGRQFGEGFALEVDDGGAAGVGDAGAVGALAVATDNVGEVLDGTSLEEGAPCLVA